MGKCAQRGAPLSHGGRSGGHSAVRSRSARRDPINRTRPDSYGYSRYQARPHEHIEYAPSGSRLYARRTLRVVARTILHGAFLVKPRGFALGAFGVLILFALLIVLGAFYLLFRFGE